ncbi:MAG TPA: hypothetical protein IAA05_12290, partial [Candidatus Blautia excrementipullorum]|nr:hypothetical protein [Candidatus Blautia excrementipullorum]
FDRIYVDGINSSLYLLLYKISTICASDFADIFAKVGACRMRWNKISAGCKVLPGMLQWLP